MTTNSPFARTRALDRQFMAAAELRAGHLDGGERAMLRQEIDDLITARALFRADAHAAAGLPPGSLDDGSLSTDALRAALQVLRGLPTP